MEEKPSKLYLLGETKGTVVTFPTVEATEVTEFFVLQYGGGAAIGLFLSRLDAEICRLYLNRQNHDSRKNMYEIVGSMDRRSEILKKSGKPPCRLVFGFVVDQATRKLVADIGCYSLMHFDVFPDDQDWLLWGGKKPQIDVLSSARKVLAKAGENGYLDELKELENLDEKSLTKLAQVAVLQVGVLTQGNATVPAIFSPRREGWIELKL